MTFKAGDRVRVRERHGDRFNQLGQRQGTIVRLVGDGRAVVQWDGRTSVNYNKLASLVRT